MSDEDLASRPSFGGGGWGTSHGATFTVGTRRLGGRGTVSDEAKDEAYPPKKRPKISSGNDTADSPTTAANFTAPGGKMTFAQRQMAKMGWKEGQGLGAEGKGRLNPIEVVQRPSGAGVGTVREKTKQAKQEEKRAAELRGETVDDSSEEERKRKKAARQARGADRAADKGVPRTKLRKPRYVSADDLETDLRNAGVPRKLLEFAINLSGQKVSDQQVSTLSGFATSHSTGPSQDVTEKRTKRIQRELLSCAESKHGLNAQRSTLADLENHLVENVDRRKEESHTLTRMLVTSKELLDTTKINDEPTTLFWEEVTAKLEVLQTAYQDQIDTFGLQEIAVAAIHPVFRKAMAEWEPLSDPMYLVTSLERLSPILSARPGPITRDKMDKIVRSSHQQRSAPDLYQSMIYSLWLPRVTSAARNDFKVEHPEPMIELIKSWRPLIPDGAYANLMNQVLIPRMTIALKSWKPPRSTKRMAYPPDSWIFPWLEYLPAYQLDAKSANSLLSDVKRKLRRLISAHPIEAGIPPYLTAWKELLGSSYPDLLASHLLPRLAAYLSQQFVIDPADQDLQPIETVLTYAPLFSADTMARLLAAEFFPKFHSTLYQWLVAPTVNYDEVTEWWTWWKAQLPTAIRDHPVLQQEWTDALNQIGRALDLGSRAAKDLEPPEPTQRDLNAAESLRRGIDTSHSKIALPNDAAMATKADTGYQRELTFRDIITDWCEEHDLLCLPTREAHTGTGEPILRITASADQRGGVLAYVRGDVLYARNKKDRSLWMPIELGPELEKRASER